MREKEEDGKEGEDGGPYLLVDPSIYGRPAVQIDETAGDGPSYGAASGWG